MKKFTVAEETSLKNFTDNTCAQASFCFRRLLKAREIRVNGVKTGADIALHRGDEVCYYMTAAEEAKTAFSIVYEDENVAVLDKESGVNSEAVFSSLGAGYFPVHRLDRNTEGLLILAKNPEAEGELLSAFREKRVEKVYYALVSGKMPKAHAVERAYLLKDRESSTVKILPTPRGKGEVPIVTEYEVLQERGECSLLKVTLHTGRTHQIRAHLAFLGHPVLGDEKYGDAALNRRLRIARQKLLAKQLTLHTAGVLSYLGGKRFLSSNEL